MTKKSPTALAEIDLEQLRRNHALRIDAQGKWWDGEVPFTHERIIEALNRGLNIHPVTGEATVQVGQQWCYVGADLTPLLALRYQVGLDGYPVILINNGREHTLGDAEYHSRQGLVFIRLEDGRLIRLSRNAQAQLGEYLEEDGASLVITTARGRWPVRPLPS